MCQQKCELYGNAKSHFGQNMPTAMFSYGLSQIIGTCTMYMKKSSGEARQAMSVCTKLCRVIRNFVTTVV